MTDSSSTYPASRPDLVSGVAVINDNYRDTLQYLNPAASARIPIVAVSGAQARPGNLKRNEFNLPGVWNVNASLVKSFDITERVHFRLRADFLNAFNHTNLAGLNTNISSGSFGRFTAATARAIQLGARVSF